MRWLVLILLFVPNSAQADELALDHSRVVSILANDKRISSVNTSPDASQTLLFAQGEKITSVKLSDPSAYDVVVSSDSGRVIVRANGPRSLALMSIETNRGEYELQLVSSAQGTVPSVISFGTAVQAAAPQLDAALGGSLSPDGFRSWKVKGDSVIRPQSVRDDGQRTYIEWHNSQPIPATLAVEKETGEQILDGHMRFDLFIIDRVVSRLVFRLDDASATAEPKSDGRRRGERD